MRNFARYAVPTTRILLGLAFTVFGLNGFLHFLPQPPPPAAGGAFLGALAATTYMFPLIKGTELLVGLLLLSNRFVPLALTLLAPVLVNILGYHLFLAPAGLAVPLVFTALELGLAWAYRDAFRPMLRASTRPAAAGAVSDDETAHTARTVAAAR